MKIVADAEELGELEGLSDAELVQLVREGFKKFRQGNDALGGLMGNTGEAKEIEPTDHTGDDPPPTPGTPRPERNGRRLTAQDAASVLAAGHALTELEIRQSGTANLEGELHLSRIRQGRSDSASVRAMDQAIPGYGRLK